MKFQVDGQDVFELSELDMTLLKSQVHEDFLEDELKARYRFIIEHLRDEVWKDFFAHWGEKMMNTGAPIPANKDQFISTVVARPDYESSKVKQQRARVAHEASVSASVIASNAASRGAVSATVEKPGLLKRLFKF